MKRRVYFPKKYREHVLGGNMHEGKIENGLGADYTKSIVRIRPLQR